MPLATERDIWGVTVIPIEISLDDVDDAPRPAALFTTPLFGQLPPWGSSG